jgi:hypothetical protein
VGLGRVLHGRDVRLLAILATAALLALAAAGAASAEAKPLKTAIILVKFGNAPSEQIGDVEEARRTLHDGPKSVSAYLDYISGGKVTLSGRDHARAEVYGPFTIAAQNTTTSPCSHWAWTEQADAELKKTGANLDGYDRLIYGFPRLKMACGWDGLASMPGKHVWQNGNWGFGVLSHEIGHTFGWSHAGNYTCTAGGQRVSLAPISQCTASDGGDPWNLMGVGASKTPDAYRLGQAEFLSKEQRQVVTQSGEYTIKPMQPVSEAGTKVLRIPRNGQSSIDLEFRQPDTRFDDYAATDPVVNGVTARIALTDRAPTVVGPGGRTAVIDSTPGTEQSQVFTDAPFGAGQALEDPETGLKITTKSVGPGGAVVDVQMPYTPDVNPPTKPTDLRAEPQYAATPGGPKVPIKLSWKASTDDVGVEGYRIWRNGQVIGTVDGSTTTFTDPGADRDSWVFYDVRAFDKWYSSENAHAQTGAVEGPYAPRVDVSFPAGSPPRVVLSSKTRSDIRLNPTIFERDGRRLGFNADHRWEDRSVEPGKTYSYQVMAYTIYGRTGPATTCQVTVPGNGIQGAVNCTAPAGIPMTPASTKREGGPLGPENEPFYPREGHAWAGTGQGAPAFWVQGHHIEHWAFPNYCPGSNVAHSVVYSNRHIKIGEDGTFHFHGHAMQVFDTGRTHETKVLFKGHLHAKNGTVTVLDEHPGCHLPGEGEDAAGATPTPHTYKVHVIEKPVKPSARRSP